MSIYIILIILILLSLIIYIINGNKIERKEKEREVEAGRKKEELINLTKKREEDRKRKLDEEKRLIREWKQNNLVINKEVLDKNINKLKDTSNNGNSDSINIEFDKYYFEKNRRLDKYINLEKENLAQINSNIKYYDSLLHSINKIELELYVNDYELLFRNYLESLNLNSNYFLFRNSYKYNIKYYYLYDYLSNYTFSSLQNNATTYKMIRKLIYSFKEGIFNDNLPKIVSYSILNELFDVYNNKDYYICVIPASSIEKNITRNEKLLKKISDDLKINNGFDLIKRNYSIQGSLQNGVKNSINVLEGISFSNELKGKNIILLDDVITKGSSLYNFNKKLIELGVNEVYPFFIGKTYYPIEKILDELDFEYNYNNLSLLNKNISAISGILKLKNNNGNK